MTEMESVTDSENDKALTASASFPHLEGFSESLEVSEPGPEQVCFFPSGEKMETSDPFSKDYRYESPRDEVADWEKYNERDLTVKSARPKIKDCGDYDIDQEEAINILTAHPDVIKGWSHRGLINLQVKPGESLERDFKAGFRVKPFRDIDNPGFVDFLKSRGLILIQAKEAHASVQIKKDNFIEKNGFKHYISQIIKARNQQITDSILIEQESLDYQHQHDLINLLNFSVKQNMMIRMPKKSNYDAPEREDKYERDIPSPDDDAGLPLYEYAGGPNEKSQAYGRDQKCDYWGLPRESHPPFPGEAEAFIEELEGLVSPLEGR